jgi:hypothetical protein
MVLEGMIRGVSDLDLLLVPFRLTLVLSVRPICAAPIHVDSSWPVTGQIINWTQSLKKTKVYGDFLSDHLPTASPLSVSLTCCVSFSLAAGQLHCSFTLPPAPPASFDVCGGSGMSDTRCVYRLLSSCCDARRLFVRFAHGQIEERSTPLVSSGLPFWHAQWNVGHLRQQL